MGFVDHARWDFAVTCGGIMHKFEIAGADVVSSPPPPPPPPPPQAMVKNDNEMINVMTFKIFMFSPFLCAKILQRKIESIIFQELKKP